MNDEITLAQNLALAEQALSRKLVLRQAADGKTDAILQRIDDLDDQRREISERRANGQNASTDAAELALLNSDIELLQTSLAEAKAAASEVTTVTEQVVVDTTRFAWENHQQKAKLAAMVSKAQEIDALLCRAIDEIRKTGDAVTPPVTGLMVTPNLSNYWRPSRTLQTIINREFAPL